MFSRQKGLVQCSIILAPTAYGNIFRADYTEHFCNIDQFLHPCFHCLNWQDFLKTAAGKKKVLALFVQEAV